MSAQISLISESYALVNIRSVTLDVSCRWRCAEWPLLVVVPGCGGHLLLGPLHLRLPHAGLPLLQKGQDRLQGGSLLRADEHNNISHELHEARRQTERPLHPHTLTLIKSYAVFNGVLHSDFLCLWTLLQMDYTQNILCRLYLDVHYARYKRVCSHLYLEDVDRTADKGGRVCADGVMRGLQLFTMSCRWFRPRFWAGSWNGTQHRGK